LLSYYGCQRLLAAMARGRSLLKFLLIWALFMLPIIFLDDLKAAMLL
jgi:hypothetical protein